MDLSYPSFHKRIQYVRNLLIQITNKNQDLGELDQNFEGYEYKDKTNGKLYLYLFSDDLKEPESEEKAQNNENQNTNVKMDRFSKLKLGSRMGAMMESKYLRPKN